MTISLPRSTDRFKHLFYQLNQLNPVPNVLHLEGVDGWQLNSDAFTRRILQTQPNLIDRIMYDNLHIDKSTESWTYDGAIESSFPGLFKNGHHGTKGLTMSNLKCLYNALILHQYDWLVVLEDDAEMNQQVYETG